MTPATCNIDSYRFQYQGNDKYLRFFSQNDLKDWTYQKFVAHFSAAKNPPAAKTLAASYKSSLLSIQAHPATAEAVKAEVGRIIAEINNPTAHPIPPAAASSATYNIQGDFSQVNFGDNARGISITNNRSFLGKRHDRPEHGPESAPQRARTTAEELYDSLASQQSPQISQHPPRDIRKEVYKAGVNALSNQLSVADRVALRQLITGYQPISLGDHLDLMSAELTLKLKTNNVHQVNALKLALSHIVDTVNNNVNAVFRHFIQDIDFWNEIEKATITLCPGMDPASKSVYQQMIDNGSVNGDLSMKKLRISIATKKVALLESDDEIGLKVLDILDLVAKHCLVDPAAVPADKDASELTFYRKFSKILDEILDGSLLQILDGETTCDASKSVAKVHEKLFGSSIPLSNGLGRRIDLILASQNQELSTSEWKKASVSATKSLVQQAKNIRMNKAILTQLLDLPIAKNKAQDIVTVGVDFTGVNGYMFGVRQCEDVFVSRKLADLVMPTYLYQLPAFVDTLDSLYAWKNHHLKLKDIVLPAVLAKKQSEYYAQVHGHETTKSESSPNIYLTPTRRRAKKPVEPLMLSLVDEQNEDENDSEVDRDDDL